MALGAVGAMRRTLERAAAELGGRGQATRHRVAELATRAEAGTALTYHALRRYLAGDDAVREVTMAKLATQRTNFDLQDECLRLIGPDPELERAARDARLGPIGGGTDEIMREILARHVGDCPLTRRRSRDCPLRFGARNTAKVWLPVLCAATARWESCRHAWSHCAQSLPPGRRAPHRRGRAPRRIARSARREAHRRRRPRGRRQDLAASPARRPRPPRRRHGRRSTTARCAVSTTSS